MNDNRPITWIWNDADECLRPFGVWMRQRAKDQYGDGEILRLQEPVDRTQRAEGFFFSNLADMWSSLPEKYADEWWAESPESLRAFALMRTGFANIEDFPCSSAGEAKRWAARLEPMAEYCIVEVRGNVVRRYTPKSQSRKAMPGKSTFAESSSKVLGFIADLIGLDKDAEQRHP